MPDRKIAFIASSRHNAQDARRTLVAKYGSYTEHEADTIVALGGDGTMLDVLRRRFDDHKHVYGMNLGTVAFLLNEYSTEDLYKRIEAAEKAYVTPLRMVAKDTDGREYTELAINEVAIFRQSAQSANLRIIIDGKVRLEKLSSDGVMVATPAGSTAYNLSAHGPILPISANLLALTPISPFRPRRWRGALLQQDAEVLIEVLQSDRRPVSATADNFEVNNVVHVRIQSAPEKKLCMLFDKGHELEERILREQFEA